MHSPFPAAGSGDAWEAYAGDARAALAMRAGFRTYLAARAAHGSDLDAAEIIFGELVANVVDHAPGAIRILVDWEAGHAVLHLRDFGSGALDAVGVLPSAEHARGRGLYFVHAFGIAARLEAVPGDGVYARVVLPVRQSV